MQNVNKCTIIKPKPTVNCENCSSVCVCVSLCTTVIHNTAENSSDDFPSYPPDNHHSLDDVYWRGEGPKSLQRQYLAQITSTSFCSLLSCQANSSTGVANCDRLMLTTTMMRTTVTTTTTILWLRLHDDDFMTTSPWLQLYDSMTMSLLLRLQWW